MQRRVFGKWTDIDLERAVGAIQRGDFSLSEASRIYGVPKGTLSRHMTGKNKVSNLNVKVHGRVKTFSTELETELVDHLLTLESMYFGLRIDEVRKLAFELAESNGIMHSFNKESGMAGKKWFYSFLKRHPELSIRTPEATSIARSQGFNRERVSSYFELLGKIYDEEKLTPDRLYNMDESSLSTVQDGQCKIVGQKGKKRIGAVTSQERGESVTCVVCMSAVGYFVPPMLIYKRKRMKAELCHGAPPGCVFSCQEKGWMSNAGFVDWLQHFISVVRPTKESRVVLILDGHVTHCKNLEAIELAKNNGVRMVSLPPHTTHRLQPLDVSFFGPMGKYYDEAMRSWLRSNVGRAVTTWQVAELFGKSYGRAASVNTATSGFRASGPLDLGIFTDADFAPAAATDKPTSKPKFYMLKCILIVILLLKIITLCFAKLSSQLSVTEFNILNL